MIVSDCSAKYSLFFVYCDILSCFFFFYKIFYTEYTTLKIK